MAQQKKRDVILQLKEIKASKGLTNQDVVEALDASNSHLAPNTVQRFFADGSEDDINFQYETIRAIADVLLKVYSTEADDDDEVRGLKQTVQLQNILIDQLHDQLKAQIVEAEHTINKERSDHLRRIEFLRDRVEKQDIRIEQKDRLITIMMMIFLKKLDPDFSAEFGNSIQRHIGDTLGEINEYLGGSAQQD